MESEIKKLKEEIEEYLLSALTSTVGLIISSQSLPFIKKWWIRNRYVN